MAANLTMGNCTALRGVDFGSSKTWSAVSLNSTSEQTVTINGLRVATDEAFYVTKPTHQTGLGIVGCRVSADDTLAITFMNNTGSNITPTASEVYTALIGRLETRETDFVV